MDSSKQKTDPKYLHNLVMHDLCQPVVFHGLIQEWPANRWTPEDLASVLADQKVKIRIGLKEAKDWDSTQWEASCSYETTTLTNLCEWLRSSRPSDKPLDKPQDKHCKNPLLQYDPDKYWCYMDYKYMAQLFEDHPNILQAVRWRDFGFCGRDGNQSTIWIGSQGATTPGHYDTYGCNLVAQIYGRKKWHLFPPSQSDALYQTRIPYEESSVFSPINISKPDLNKYPQFTTATPYIVTLDPGDVLFVPHHWWHFVETVETSISVNTWIEMNTDHEERFHEAITRTLVSGILPSGGTQGNLKWLNPTEELCDTTTNMKYLKKAFENLTQHQKNTNQEDTKSQPAMHTSSDKTPTESHDVTDETKCPLNQVVQETGFSRHSDARYGASKNNEEDSTSLWTRTKRRKYISDTQMSTDGNRLPDFVTVVPCLGEIYKRQQLQCGSECLDDCQGNSNHSNSKETVSCENSAQHTTSNQSKSEKIDMSTEKKGKDCSENGCALQYASSESQSDDCDPFDTSEKNEIDDMLELLLESVTHPDIISHVATLMCRKMKEKQEFASRGKHKTN